MSKTGWCPELFARFRLASPDGALRRVLASQLIVANAALIRALVGQLLGREDHRFNRLGKVYDADRLEWDDALQAGYIGFARALETYNPSRGKIAAWARWAIRDELQKQTPTAAVICTPRRKLDQRPAASLVSPPMLEGIGGLDEGHVAELDGITTEMVEGWAASGQWPETIEEAREQAMTRLIVAVPVEPPITPWNAFLRDAVRVSRARVATPRALVLDAYNRHTESLGMALPLSPAELRRALLAEGATDASVREGASFLTGFRGVQIRVSHLSPATSRYSSMAMA